MIRFELDALENADGQWVASEVLPHLGVHQAATRELIVKQAIRDVEALRGNPGRHFFQDDIVIVLEGRMTVESDWRIDAAAAYFIAIRAAAHPDCTDRDAARDAISFFYSHNTTKLKEAQK